MKHNAQWRGRNTLAGEMKKGGGQEEKNSRREKGRVKGGRGGGEGGEGVLGVMCKHSVKPDLSPCCMTERVHLSLVIWQGAAFRSERCESVCV